MTFKSFLPFVGIAILFGLVSCNDSGTSSSDGTSDNSSSSLTSGSSSSGVAEGSLTDSRDSQTYKTVVIGTQTWMAQNLNYIVDNSWCYENSADSCAKYGRLYQWTSAMDITTAYTTTSWGDSDVNHQGICPDGWHLPSYNEWQALSKYVDENNGDEYEGISLKSATGWEYYSDKMTGTDLFGFSALPAGTRNYYGYFNDAGRYAYFWTTSEYDSDDADYWSLYYYGSSFYSYREDQGANLGKCVGYSVRCLKDSE